MSNDNYIAQHRGVYRISSLMFAASRYPVGFVMMNSRFYTIWVIATTCLIYRDAKLRRFMQVCNNERMTDIP